MGFEETVAEYRQAKGELAEGPANDQEFIQTMALQKAWADRMVEQAPDDLDKNAQEILTVNTTETLGDWFRHNIIEFPADEGKVSRKRYYLDLFDQDPDQAVRELYALYRSQLH